MKAWMLSVGLLLVIGMLGCGEYQTPQEQAKPAGEQAKPAKGETKRSLTVPEGGREAAIAEIEKLGGRLQYDDRRRIGAVLLHQTELTDPGLVHLQGLSSLVHLRLDETRITDAGLAHLKGLTGLRTLWLKKTQVTDVGLKYLKGLTNLRELNLDSTEVTDDGLAHLKGLTGLQLLWLLDTQVTDAGVNDLKKALPNCQIIH